MKKDLIIADMILDMEIVMLISISGIWTITFIQSILSKDAIMICLSLCCIIFNIFMGYYEIYHNYYHKKFYIIYTMAKNYEDDGYHLSYFTKTKNGNLFTSNIYDSTKFINKKKSKKIAKSLGVVNVKNKNMEFKVVEVEQVIFGDSPKFIIE